MSTQNHTLTRKFSKTTQIFLKHKFKYFIPIISNPEALQKIFKAAGNEKYDNLFQNEIGIDGNITTIEKLSELIQSTTTKGNFTYEMIRDYHDIENIGNYLKITYIAAREFTNTFPAIKTGINEDKIFTTQQQSHQSILNLSGVNETIFSADKINTLKKLNEKNSNVELNTTDQDMSSALTGINVAKGDQIFHSKQNPGLSVIQVIDPNLRACLKQSQELSVFFNLINTIDMSMAMPYINIKLLLPSIVNENVEYITASFSNFLFGNDKKEKKFNNIAKAINGDFYIDKYEYTKYVQDNLGNFNKKDVNLDRKTIDLSLFTMPQTIVNGDEKFYGDYESFDPKDLDGRLSIIHDKFRPFMSIESIDFDVRPTKELMSFKTATMNLILYDKSRLNEVLALVKPDLLGAYGSELLIEYGWQHILGDTDYVSEDAINPIAEFINSLKNFEKYQITNSSYSIQENGQVNITLNITMKGPLDIRGTPVFHDFLEYSTLKQLKHIIQNIKDLKVYEDDEPNKIHFSLEGNLKDSLLETMNEENIDDFINNFNAFFIPRQM